MEKPLRLTSSETGTLAYHAVAAVEKPDPKFFEKAKQNFPWLTQELAVKEREYKSRRDRDAMAILGLVVLGIVQYIYVPDSIAPVDIRVHISQGLIIIGLAKGLWHAYKFRSPIEESYFKIAGGFRREDIQSRELDDLLQRNQSSNITS